MMMENGNNSPRDCVLLLEVTQQRKFLPLTSTGRVGDGSASAEGTVEDAPRGG
jgi:hypothetical protein